ncbi:MAG: FHA domain-containing protein [Planctomycetota bacterium]
MSATALSTFSLALRDPYTEASYWLEPGGQLFVGRHPTNDLVVDRPQVSRFHATLVWDRGAERPVLRDLNSQNGTRLDGEPLAGDEPVVLHGGERLTFGGARFDVELVHEGVAAPALLTEDSSEVLLFSDHGPSVEGYVWNRESLLRKLLQLEDERRTGTFTFNDGQGSAQLVVGLGRVLAATWGERSGRAAVEALLQASRGYYSFSRSFEPTEAQLELSVRALLALDQDDTRRMRRVEPEDVVGPSGTLFTLNLNELWGA